MDTPTNTPTAPLAAETEALREAYAALNRNDVAGFIAIFDPQIERIEPADFPQAGTYHGLEAVKAHVAKGRGTWAEGGCEPQRFIVAGDRIIVLVHVRVRLKNETQWREGDVADVFTFRNGKAIQFRTFADGRQAMDWAGVQTAGSSGDASTLPSHHRGAESTE
ncbi:MAG: nuclear transport factor 2 family protein [Phycisphaerales bacterium JB039]